MSLIKRQNQTNDWFYPLEALADMRSDLDRFFFGSLRNLKDRNIPGLFIPEIELAEDANQYVVKAELPGMKKEDVQITLQGSTLVMKGEKKEEKEKKDKNFYHSERRYGAFERAVELATEVDFNKVKASFKEGVLEVVIPKSEQAKPKEIQVNIQ